MKKTIEIESDFKKDSRIKELMSVYNTNGLGIYFSIRIAIESMNKDGLSLPIAMAICQDRASRRMISRVIKEFDLFNISDDGIVTVNPLKIK